MFLLSFILLSMILFMDGSVSAQDEELTKFLAEGIEKYPSWLRNNALDPTSISRKTYDLEYFSEDLNIRGLIRDQVVSGHSNLTNCRGDAYFEDRVLWVGCYVSACTLGGDYAVQGNISSFPSYDPVKGSGKFFIKESDSIPARLELLVENFVINPEGYIDISTSKLHFVNKILDFNFLFETDFFEGLDGGGQERKVIDRIKKVHVTRRLEWLTVGDYLVEYLGVLFSSTPVSEIIGNGTIPM